MSDIRKALLHSIANSYSLKLLGILSTIVIAHLMTPGEIGTFAIASSLIMWLSQIKLMGANLYIVREKEINHQKIRAALGVSVILSWSIGLALVAAAGPLGNFFKHPGEANLIRILAIPFLFNSHTSVYQAVLTRNLKFNVLFKSNLISSIISFAVTVLLIFLNFSFYALALGYVARELIFYIGIHISTKRGTPVLPGFSGISAIMKLGVYSSTSSLMRQAQFNFPDLLIGKFGTTAQVGIFSRGLGFVQFINDSVTSGTTPLSLPYLSKNNQSASTLEASYIKASVHSNGLLWPVLAVVAVFSKQAIVVLFGSQWAAAAPLATIIAGSAIIRTTHLYANQYLVASSKEHYLIIKDLITFVVYLLSALLYFKYSLIGLAFSYLIIGIQSFIITPIILKVVGQFSIQRFLLASVPSFLMTISCFLAALVLRFISEKFNFGDLLSVLSVALIMPFIWLATATMVSHPISNEIKSLVQNGLSRFR